MTVFDSSPELCEALANSDVEVILEDKLASFYWLNNTKAGKCCEFRGNDVKDPTYFSDGADIAVRKGDMVPLIKPEAALAAIT